jgi:hypothetical protein
MMFSFETGSGAPSQQDGKVVEHRVKFPDVIEAAQCCKSGRT